MPSSPERRRTSSTAERLKKSDTLFRDSAYDSANIHFNNVLLLQAKYDEFSYFRDYKNVVDDSLLKSDLRTEFLGCTADEAAWNTTYGSFEDGTARRMELLNTNHRLTTHNAHGLAAALDWFSETIGLDQTLAPTDQVAMTKETLVLIAMLAAVASLMAVMELLLTTPFFSGAVQPLPAEASVKPNGAWWRNALMMVGGILIIVLIEYIPFFMNIAPGADLLFGSTFGGPFMSLLILFVPQVLVFSVLCTYAYRRTGSVYAGALTAASLACWIVTGGSSML